MLKVVINGYWWFLMIIDTWLLVVINGYWWLLMVSGGY